MKKEKYLIILMALSAVVMAFTAYAGSSETATGQQIKAKLQRPYFAMSYTPEFADRFSLPKEKAIKLSEGMQAIAVEIRPEYDDYNIYHHLYLDSSLNLDFPNTCGDYQTRSIAEWFFLKGINDSDQKYRFENTLQELRRNRMQSRSLGKGKDGIVNSLNYYSVKRNFLPGITLVSLYGQLPFALGKEYGPAEIVMQKAGRVDYILIDDPDAAKCSENCYRFEIPEKLQNHLDPFIQFIRKEFSRNDPEVWDPGYDYL